MNSKLCKLQMNNLTATRMTDESKQVKSFHFSMEFKEHVIYWLDACELIMVDAVSCSITEESYSALHM
jgi:hypothetical protein